MSRKRSDNHQSSISSKKSSLLRKAGFVLVFCGVLVGIPYYVVESISYHTGEASRPGWSVVVFLGLIGAGVALLILSGHGIKGHK